MPNRVSARNRRADQTAASLAGFVVLQCHLHGDVSFASRRPRNLVDPFQTLVAFENTDVSGLCRNAGQMKGYVP
jgi:hypothetical protein